MLPDGKNCALLGSFLVWALVAPESRKLGQPGPNPRQLRPTPPQAVCGRPPKDFLSGNNRLRPPPRTPCASYCVYESGRWGGSWCWTEREGTPDRNWGAPCAPCANDADALELPGVGAEAERSWPGLAVLEPAPYRVCWCPGSRTGCAAGEHFDIEAPGGRVLCSPCGGVGACWPRRAVGRSGARQLGGRRLPKGGASHGADGAGR